MPVVINGQRLMIDVLHYTLGGQDAPIESTFLTTRNYEPISVAKDTVDYDIYRSSEYIWSVQTAYTEISKDEYDAAPKKGAITIYPEAPSEKFADGQKHYMRVSYMPDVMPYPHVYCRVEAWLICTKRYN